MTPFIIIKGNDDGYILYLRTSKTLELLSKRSNIKDIVEYLKSFCAKFFTKKDLEKYANEYTSMNTRQGIIYKVYNEYALTLWNEIYAPVFSDTIDNLVEAIFSARKLQGIKKLKFRVRA